jgi:hypothetical protein
MLPDPHPVFFPPWYFWVFIFGVVVVVVGGLVTLIVSVKRVDSAQRIRERELAAELIERMLAKDLAPIEIERLVDCYWQLGCGWARFQRLWTRFRPVAASKVPSKLLAK